MDEFEFELIVAGVDMEHEPTVVALHDAGLDDATIAGQRGSGLATIAVARSAASLADALLSAIRQVESVHGVRVVRVDPDELLTAADIAHRTGRGRSSIAMLISGERGAGDFPQPAVRHADRSPLWRWREVDAWLARHEGRAVDERPTALIAAVNGVLEARAEAATLAAPERQMLADLLLAS